MAPPRTWSPSRRVNSAGFVAPRASGRPSTQNVVPIPGWRLGNRSGTSMPPPRDFEAALTSDAPAQGAEAALADDPLVPGEQGLAEGYAFFAGALPSRHPVRYPI